MRDYKFIPDCEVCRDGVLPVSYRNQRDAKKKTKEFKN